MGILSLAVSTPGSTADRIADAKFKGRNKGFLEGCDDLMCDTMSEIEMEKIISYELEKCMYTELDKIACGGEDDIYVEDVQWLLNRRRKKLGLWNDNVT